MDGPWHEGQQRSDQCRRLLRRWYWSPSVRSAKTRPGRGFDSAGLFLYPLDRAGLCPRKTRKIRRGLSESDGVFDGPGNWLLGLAIAPRSRRHRRAGLVQIPCVSSWRFGRVDCDRSKRSAGTESPLESRLQPAPDRLKPGLQQMQSPVDLCYPHLNQDDVPRDSRVQWQSPFLILFGL
jgi:hypothetical protein